MGVALDTATKRACPSLERVDGILRSLPLAEGAATKRVCPSLKRVDGILRSIPLSEWAGSGRLSSFPCLSGKFLDCCRCALCMEGLTAFTRGQAQDRCHKGGSIPVRGYAPSEGVPPRREIATADSRFSRCASSRMTSAMSARMSSRVTADSSARAARTMAPRFTEEHGSSANSEEDTRIVSPAEEAHGCPPCLRTSSTAACSSSLRSRLSLAICSPFSRKLCVACSTDTASTWAFLERPFFLLDGPLLLVFTSVVTWGGSQSSGPLVLSSSRLLVLWPSGPLALWPSGPLVFSSSRPLALWPSGPLALWPSSPLVLSSSRPLAL
ncbi:hypothetical protein EYF80_057013 [Liparis tanakae]|uniref:Uncharacterized protein n=1 Tax=Liparis tanakae TaxID=230148 RepID=A0A4Z2EVD2_9TELE|nr:hypothetical protein EYF80_057013 [Liparis tanakae]